MAAPTVPALVGDRTSAVVEIGPSTVVVVGDRRPRMLHRADCPFLHDSVVRPARTEEVAGVPRYPAQFLPYCQRCRAQDYKERRQ